MTNTEAPDAREQLDVDATVTHENGVTVPITFTIRWPRGEGMTALAVVGRLGEFEDRIGRELLNSLVNAGDLGVLAAMARNGVELGEED